jgi:hypothetical protein
MPRYTRWNRVMRRGHARNARHALSWTRPDARVVQLVTVLLAVVCLATITMVTRPPTAHGSAAANVTRQFVGPNGVPDTGRWQDEAQKTAFAIRFTVTKEPPGNAYSFTLPSGDQIAGALSLQKRENGDFVGFSCDTSAQLLGDKPRQVVAQLATHIDAHALGGFAQITVTEIPSSEPGNLDSLCGHSTDIYTMQSGCGPSDACVDPVATASVAPPQYENKLIAANEKPSPTTWGPVYNASSSVIRGQYNSEQFADAMARAIKKVGTITAITPVAETVVVQTAKTGEIYFIAHSNVTFSLKGKSSTRTVASYYLLEGGQWRFWFSV